MEKKLLQLTSISNLFIIAEIKCPTGKRETTTDKLLIYFFLCQINKCLSPYRLLPRLPR